MTLAVEQKNQKFELKRIIIVILQNTGRIKLCKPQLVKIISSSILCDSFNNYSSIRVSYGKLELLKHRQH